MVQAVGPRSSPGRPVLLTRTTGGEKVAIEMAIARPTSEPARVSIADARDALARLVHEAEAGTPVELTRRGKPVAVVLGIEDYRRLLEPRASVAEVLERVRLEHDVEHLEIDPDEVWAGVRAVEAGREFSW